MGKTKIVFALNQSAESEVVNGMNFDNGLKSFYDIGTKADTWQWIEEGIIPRCGTTEGISA